MMTANLIIWYLITAISLLLGIILISEAVKKRNLPYILIAIVYWLLIVPYRYDMLPK